MKEIDVIRAWKDEKYRLSLTPEELAQLPPNPTGTVEIADEDLSASGGATLKEIDDGCTCTCCTCCDC